MAQRALLLNKILYLTLFLFCSCYSRQKGNLAVTVINVTANDANLRMQNGVAYYKRSLLNGTVYAFHPDTNDTAWVNRYKNGREDGEWKKFYPGNKLQELRFFSNGKKEGIMRGFWEGGQWKLEYHFANDEYEGTCSEWMPDGTLTKEMNYVKGHEEGSQKLFFENGKMKSNYIIKNGRRYGLLGTKNCINVKDSIFK